MNWEFKWGLLHNLKIKFHFLEWYNFWIFQRACAVTPPLPLCSMTLMVSPWHKVFNSFRKMRITYFFESWGFVQTSFVNFLTIFAFCCNSLNHTIFRFIHLKSVKKWWAICYLFPEIKKEYIFIRSHRNLIIKNRKSFFFYKTR